MELSCWEDACVAWSRSIAVTRVLLFSYKYTRSLEPRMKQPNIYVLGDFLRSCLEFNSRDEDCRYEERFCLPSQAPDSDPEI